MQTLEGAMAMLEGRLEDELEKVVGVTDETELDTSYQFIVSLFDDPEWKDTEEREALLKLLEDTETYPKLEDSYSAMLEYIWIWDEVN